MYKDEDLTSSPNISNTPVICRAIRHGSLFSGIGGFDLASSWMGWENIFQVEIDNFCQKVLNKNFPETKKYLDIKDFDGNEYKETIDIISGGFPCQPFSIAGQRKGKDDDRYIWKEMLRVVGEVKPSFIVCENVTGIIGLALDTVLSDLEAQGYTTETFVIPACGKNAWHRRDRVWIVAYTNGIRWKNEQEKSGELIHNGKWNDKTKEQSRKQQQRRISQSGFISANTNNTGCKEQWQSITNGEKFFAPKCSSWWEVEPGMGRVANGIPGRVDRLKGLGNSIVPQVVYEIIKVVGCVLRHGI